MDGSIIATHLGEGRYTADVAIDYANGWWEGDAVCGELLPGSTFTFVAANGDELDGSLVGYGCLEPLTMRGWGTFQGEFTGGTGRFADATATVQKVFTGQNMVIQSSWEGWIEY